MSRYIFISNFVFCFLITVSISAQDLSTPFEKDNNYSANYHETTEYYTLLDSLYDICQVNIAGSSDAGLPIYEVIISANKAFTPEEIRSQNKGVLFINNAIHPGEPCGVDACMMLARNICQNPEKQSLLENFIIVIIPYYNVGGGLNRGSHSRANQEGPKYYGFRGNAKNLDLNRDFIKCDSKNAKTFNTLFNKWNPEVFIDNHTSNGADYQYVLTLIATQKDKLGGNMAKLMEQKMLPAIYSGMKNTPYEMTPYVYASKTPDDGIYGFLEGPRYSTGYAALNHTIGFMPETHMLKPFKDRVWSVYYFMETMIKYLNINIQEIIAAKQKDILQYASSNTVPIEWTLDEQKVDTILFKGFEASYKKSDITGIDRLFYDHNKPYEKNILHFNNYKVKKEIKKPKAYIVPQAYENVIQRLKWNNVTVDMLHKDSMINIEVYYIDEYKTREKAYEGHYLHYDVSTKKEQISKQYYKGDYIIYTGQDRDRYIIETLEPEAPDGFFAWNFFDGILMQKEHFSSYVFEDLAVELLEANPMLKSKFINKKKRYPEFANDGKAQLDFIYKNSIHFESTYLQYPIGRIF